MKTDLDLARKFFSVMGIKFYETKDENETYLWIKEQTRGVPIMQMTFDKKERLTTYL